MAQEIFTSSLLPYGSKLGVESALQLAPADAVPQNLHQRMVLDPATTQSFSSADYFRVRGLNGLPGSGVDSCVGAADAPNDDAAGIPNQYPQAIFQLLQPCILGYFSHVRIYLQAQRLAIRE